MDWLLVSPQIQSAFSSLGSLEGDTYVVSPNALAVLEEINYKLKYEDQTLRTYRRAIGFGQNVRTDLIPLLENAKDDAVLDAVIRILVNLTVPVECLFSVDVMYRTEVGRQTIFELNKLLYTSKEAFAGSKSTKAVIEYMKHILEYDSKLPQMKCDRINNCLLLLRNILHIPEINTNFIVPGNGNGGHTISMQNLILWILFIQSIDKVLLYLIRCPQRAFWSVTMVQLIALMYKDQHVSTLQKLLNIWFEASLSESSEDNESNTTPTKQGSGDSSPMLTSDPTSDSSDNGSNSKKNNSEDRRQALREETEYTLKEVSREVQEYQDFEEYQNSMKCSSTPEDIKESCSSSDGIEELNSSENVITKTEKYFTEIVEIEDEEESDTKVVAMKQTDIIQPPSSPTHIKNQKRKFKHLVHFSSHTTKQKLPNDDKKFMPPPSMPAKSSVTARIAEMEQVLPDSPPQPHQKVRHSGQVNLTKGTSCPQKRECPSSQSELSDCGYATQIDNKESISTSSNDDDTPKGKPQHQKPPCSIKPRNKQRVQLTVIDKKELRRKKLVRRGKSSLINMKGLVQHTPTDDDISNVLKEFTVDFLLKGYGILVQELHKQLLTDLKIPIDTSHFFWLVTYFLKFAAQLELDMEHISTVLNYDILGYLTYEGVTLCEQLELNSRQEGYDLKPYIRRIHLVVTAIREFLQAIETYKKVTHLSEDDRASLRRLQIQISSTKDLHCMFVLLLRRFKPDLHTKQYLQDLIVTNHMLLLILDSVTKDDDSIKIKMLDHISQFATMEVMQHYGLLLEDFKNNGEFVNDCIFTMMHHVGGDLGQVSALFQPVILKTYSHIWETDYQLRDDWSDLIEHVIHKFMNTPQKNQLAYTATSLTELTKEHNLKNAVCSWTQEEMDTLYWYYVRCKKEIDAVGKIQTLFTNNGNKHKSRIAIINQLLHQDIITLVEYDDLMHFEDAEYQRTLLTTSTSCTTESGIELKSTGSLDKPTDDIQFLRNFILKENKGKHLIWLQKMLLECCYIKLILKKFPLREDHQKLESIMEPVAYHAIMKNKSIPVVQWNSAQATMMVYQPFVLLLHKLGFQLPADAGSIFARIPNHWNADTMFSLVKKLGPIDKLTVKFDTSELEKPTSTSHHAKTGNVSLLSTMSCNETIISDSGPSTSKSCNSSMLSPIPEIEIKEEKSNEIFGIPKAKHCNSIIRFTPDPSPVPSIPNWLQMVMRSKCTATATVAAAAASLQGNAVLTSQIPSSSTMLATNQRIETDVTIHCSHTSNDSVTLTSKSTLSETTKTLQHKTSVTSETIAATAILTTKVEAAETSKVNDQHQSQQEHDHVMSLKSTALSNPNILVSNHDKNKNQQQVNNNLNSLMQTTNKTNSNKFNENESQLSNDLRRTPQLLSMSSTMLPENTKIPIVLAPHHQQQKEQQNVTNNDVMLIKSDDEQNDSIPSSFSSRNVASSSRLEKEYSTMIAAVYEQDTDSDTASVNSNLTRMYVSDEDERHEIEVPSNLK